MAGNLRRRHQTYYVRVGVNPSYQKLIGRSETVRSLGTRDKAIAEAKKHGVIQAIKDFHERLIREAQAGVQGFGDEVMELRRKVEDGSLDEGAVEIAHDILEARLKALGKSADEIEKMTAEDVGTSVRDPFRMLRDPNYLPLSAAIKQYLDVIENDVIPRTWDQKKKQLDLFADWVGNVNVNDIGRRLSSRYINESMVPKGLAPNTNKSNVAVLSSFFNWLIDNSMYDHPNPFARKGKSLGGSRKGSDFIANRAWTPAELGKLFKELEKQRKGTVKWKAGIAARIALYSGMRQEEVCAMETKAVNLDDGFMSVGDPKNPNSVRQVPIHPAIRNLISELVESTSDEFLIEALPAGTRDMKRGHSLGNRFSDMKRELFPDSRPRELTFHGLRSTFITAMEQAGIPESTAKLIDGHARQSLSYGLYSKGPGFDSLAEAVSKVKIEIKS